MGRSRPRFYWNGKCLDPGDDWDSVAVEFCSVCDDPASMINAEELQSLKDGCARGYVQNAAVHEIERLQARVDALEGKNGKLLTVLYSADAFMRCPTENYLELANLAETLRDAIDIASDKHDPAAAEQETDDG